MNNGRLFGVGVGPGDPELLTLKAVKIIKQCSVLIAPKTKGERNIALDIVKSAVELSDKEILCFDFPMVNDMKTLESSYEEKEKAIEKYLLDGKDVSFITLGDASIYSTFSYIQKIAEKRGFKTEVCPGITSFCAVGAALKTSLASMREPLHIIPAVHGDIEEMMELNGTKVFMKAGKSISRIYKCAEKMGLNAMGISNCTMYNEKIVENIDESYGYFTTVVVKEES